MVDKADECSFESMFDNDDSFQLGVRAAVIAMRVFLDWSDVPIIVSDEAWIGHIVAANGCGCDIDLVYEGEYDEQWCDWYKEHHREWFLKWHGMTEEELAAKERAAAEEDQRKEQVRIERDKQYRLEKLHELAKEFGVDPKLLP